MEAGLNELRRRAMELVGDHYEQTAAVARLNLDELNRTRPPSMQYRARDEVLREWLSAAGAVATFAVNLDLITPDQARAAIVDFYQRHPDLREALDL